MAVPAPPPAPNPQNGYGKLLAGGGGIGASMAFATLLAKVVNAKWPGFLDAADGSMVAFVTLVNALVTLPLIYIVPHDSVGGSP